MTKEARRWLHDRGILIREPLKPVKHEHTLPSPFPLEVGKLVKSTVVDERCTCGLLRSAHADSHDYGTGPAFAGGCEAFTWEGYVLGSPRFPYYTRPLREGE